MASLGPSCCQQRLPSNGAPRPPQPRGAIRGARKEAENRSIGEERREKREVTFKNVNGHCSRVKAPDLDKNGLPIVVFRNNNDFDTLYNRSCVDQSEYPPQRPRAHSEVTTSSRTCIDQFNPYLGYFVFAAEAQPVKKSPDKKGRDFFQRYNLLSNAKLRARKDRKLNPLSGKSDFL